MDDNEKIATWAGQIIYNEHLEELETYPDYATDAAAIELLNVLAKKKYKPMLVYMASNGYWHFHYNWVLTAENGYPSCFMGKTIAEAITKGVLHLIEKETPVKILNVDIASKTITSNLGMRELYSEIKRLWKDANQPYFRFEFPFTIEDVLVEETDDYVVVKSTPVLIDGWQLIRPNRHN